MEVSNETVDGEMKGRNAYFYLIPCFLVFAVFRFLSICENHISEPVFDR